MLYYLAAAVSDFYIPPSLLPQHKIQSGPLPPSLETDQQQEEQQDQKQQDQEQQKEQQDQKEQASPPPLLHLALHPVPKRLGTLVSHWAPAAFVTSFKLETDLALVVRKAQLAISNYDVHLVVANQLQTRRDVVHLVQRSPLPPFFEVEEVRRPPPSPFIEHQLVAAVISRHDLFCSAGGGGGA